MANSKKRPARTSSKPARKPAARNEPVSTKGVATGAIARITYDGTLFSPFSGQPVDSGEGPNEADETLLFAHYGGANEYGYISIRALSGRPASTVDGLSPRSLCKKLGLHRAVLLEVDAGFEGINTYAFQPARS